MTFEILPGWLIPSREISIRAVHSSGPGGQNVNKVSTKVQLRFSALHSTALSVSHKARLAEKFKGYLTQSGELLISCDETRSLETNKEIAQARLRRMLVATATPAKRRRETRPTRGSKERRLDGKKRRAAVKQQRRSPAS